MKFGDWIEQSESMGVPRLEIDAAIAVYERLRVSKIIATNILTQPDRTAILSVFAQIERQERVPDLPISPNE